MDTKPRTVTLHHSKNAITNMLDSILSNSPNPKLFTAVTHDWFLQFGDDLLRILRENRKTE